MAERVTRGEDYRRRGRVPHPDTQVSAPEPEPRLFTRRAYLMLKATPEAGIFGAIEAVSSTAIEHPEWDMDEQRTWAQWEKG